LSGPASRARAGKTGSVLTLSRRVDGRARTNLQIWFPQCTSGQGQSRPRSAARHCGEENTLCAGLQMKVRWEAFAGDRRQGQRRVAISSCVRNAVLGSIALVCFLFELALSGNFFQRSDVAHVHFALRLPCIISGLHPHPNSRIVTKQPA